MLSSFYKNDNYDITKCNDLNKNAHKNILKGIKTCITIKRKIEMKIMSIINTQPKNNKSQSTSFNGKLYLKLKSTADIAGGWDKGLFEGYTMNIMSFLSKRGQHNVQYHEIKGNPYNIYFEFDKELDIEASEILNEVKQKGADSEFNRVIEPTFTPSP